jgi:hypothetical protein
MFVARWQLTSKFGKVEDTISLLRRWEIDVGERVGWKPSAVRLVSGFIGSSESDIEFEAHADNLADLEGAFNDMQRNPHHREYLKQLESVVSASRWVVLRQVEVIPGQD